MLLEKEQLITYVKKTETKNSYRILALETTGNVPFEDREGNGRKMLN
jgi:hypothetical protein